MNLSEKIKMYLGRDYLETEILLTGDIKTNSVNIEKWNIQEIEKPSLELLDTIPEDGKVYRWNGTEFTIDVNAELEKYKAEILELISERKKTPFAVAITDIKSETGNYYVDLQDGSILSLLVLVKKAEITGQASDEFVNADTEAAEYKTFSLQAIEAVQAEVIQKDDFLKLKANEVKNAETTTELETIEQELAAF